MSDYHEMATHMRMQEERSLLLNNHELMVNTDGRRFDLGKRHFSYWDYLTKKKITLITEPFQKEPLIRIRRQITGPL